MIGILIKYERKILFTRLPKDSERLKNQLEGIGLKAPLQSINLSNHNDIGYEIEIFPQDKLDIEIASRIILHDNIGQLNDLITYVSQRDADEMYNKICESYAETIKDLYKEITAPPKPEATEKFIIKTNLNHKATYYEPSDCVVEKVIALPAEEFQHLLNEPLDDYALIKDNRMMMYCDENEVEHCILVYDEESGDGLLINAEGYDYARYSAFVPHAKDIAEQFEMEQNGIQTVKAPVTDSEKRLLDLISSTADRIATLAHLGSSDFILEDVLKELDYTLDDVKDMILHATVEKVGAKPDIASVEVNSLIIPLQPEITVTTIEETEVMTAENEGLGGLSF